MGKVSGFRGVAGELTVRVLSGDAGRWTGLRSVLVSEPEWGNARDGGKASFEVERCRAYRDRLVLKLKGIDDASGAEALKGRWVLAPAEQVPALPRGVYWVERLVGLDVVGERGEFWGKVEDVAATGGVDLLVVRRPGGEELLVPMAEGIVLEIGEPSGPVLVRLPDGLAPEGGGETERR